jgi:hypothetical protein
MRNATRVLGFATALAFVAGTAAAQNSNDSPFNNNGDVVFLYSSPSSGFSSLAFPPDVNGDLYWRSHSGAAFMNDVDPLLGSAMEIDGYYESLFDTDWSTSPSFYVRNHGPALPSLAGNGNLEPAFFQVGLGGGDTVVLVGPSGFGNPCTIVASLCSPSGGTCPPTGFVNGYLTQLTFGSTPGSGIVMPADGTAASDMATTWFVTGGMTASGGTCGLGDYDIQDVHSTNETQADLGFGINPSGGLQAAASGPIAEGVASMAEGHVTWRGNIVNIVANSGVGGGSVGVETGDNGGGAMNGRNLPVAAGGSTIGVELRDLNSALALPGLNIGIVGASLGVIPNPGFPALGGNLLVFPDGLFNATSGAWQGPIATGSFVFTTEGSFAGIQLSVPPSAAGAKIHVQGAAFSFLSFGVDSTNALTVSLN